MHDHNEHAYRPYRNSSLSIARFGKPNDLRLQEQEKSLLRKIPLFIQEWESSSREQVANQLEQNHNNIHSHQQPY